MDVSSIWTAASWAPARAFIIRTHTPARRQRTKRLDSKRWPFKRPEPITKTQTQTKGDESIGSAFQVGEGVFVTARHVVENVVIREIRSTHALRRPLEEAVPEYTEMSSK